MNVHVLCLYIVSVLYSIWNHKVLFVPMDRHEFASLLQDKLTGGTS